MWDEVPSPVTSLRLDQVVDVSILIRNRWWISIISTLVCPLSTEYLSEAFAITLFLRRRCWALLWNTKEDKFLLALSSKGPLALTSKGLLGFHNSRLLSLRRVESLVRLTRRVRHQYFFAASLIGRLSPQLSFLLGPDKAFLR